MACHQVVDGEDILQIWKVAVNTLNKQLQTAGKGWSSSLGGLSEGMTPQHKKLSCYEMLRRVLEWWVLVNTVISL